MRKLLLPLLLVVAACGLSVAQKADIARDRIELDLCATEAHMAKVPDASSQPAAYAVFDSCMARHGFYDGGHDDAR